MVTVTSLVEFLLSLLRDDEARAEFEQNPEAVLARNGLDDLCLTDVTDAAPLLADRNDVEISAGSPSPVAGAATGGAVQEITHITKNYEVDKSVQPDEPDVYNIHNVDDRDRIINVDDRDVTTIQSAGDVNIDDSFNQDNDAAIIEDSYNQDNDGLDNKGGMIDDSNAGGGGSINVGNEPGSGSDDSVEGAADDLDGSDGGNETSPHTQGSMSGDLNEINVEAGSGEAEHDSSGTHPEDTQPDPTVDDGQDQLVDSV